MNLTNRELALLRAHLTLIIETNREHQQFIQGHEELAVAQEEVEDLSVIRHKVEREQWERQHDVRLGD